VKDSEIRWVDRDAVWKIFVSSAVMRRHVGGRFGGHLDGSMGTKLVLALVGLRFGGVRWVRRFGSWCDFPCGSFDCEACVGRCKAVCCSAFGVMNRLGFVLI